MKDKKPYLTGGVIPKFKPDPDYPAFLNKGETRIHPPQHSDVLAELAGTIMSVIELRAYFQRNDLLKNKKP